MLGGLSGLAGLLSGCGVLRGSGEDPLNDTVRQFDGVTASELSLTGGGGLRTGMTGRITFGVTGEELIEALDPAWRAVTEHIYELDEGFENRAVQAVAEGADGETVSPTQLLGSSVADSGTSVGFGLFFEHYGLT